MVLRYLKSSLDWAGRLESPAWLAVNLDIGIPEMRVTLANLPLDKMVAISQTTCSNVFREL